MTKPRGEYRFERLLCFERGRADVAEYIFDNAAVQAEQRFTNLELLLDDHTTRRLEAIGVAEAWACLEIGGGGGTVASWLSRRVGPTGRVVVTDIDLSHLGGLRRETNVEVLQHDVGKDAVEEAAFDLVHERLVLVHVRDRREALRRLARALKPGGWLVVEGFDPPFADNGWLIQEPSTAARFRKMHGAMAQLMAGRGAEPGWGRNLYWRLRELGLEEVGMDGYLAVGAGGEAAARLERANFEQVRAEAEAAGLIGRDEVDEVLASLDDPRVVVSTPVLFTAWGRRPAL
jgi:ubiquinone/menaquinone biosynthesis C-methylase UbiE